MISNLKRKGTRKEEMIVSELKKEGYDIAQRSAGSNSPIDIFAISIKNKTIKLIQSKRVMNQSMSFVNEKLKKELEEEYKYLNGLFNVVFEVR